MNKITSYKSNKIELVYNAPRVIDVYINDIPRICRSNVWECMKDAKAIIDGGLVSLEERE